MESKKGMSDSDNETADRLLMFAAVGIVCVLALIVSPIMIGGFLIGLTWYGAYMEGGEPNGDNLIWPVVITLALFVYLFGAPLIVSDYFQGVMFTDFAEWMSHQVWGVIGAFNQMLPKKFMIRNITVGALRLYIWTLIPAAALTTTYLHFRGAGRGGFLYRGIWMLFAPFRMYCARIVWVLGGAFVGAALCMIFNSPYYVRTGLALLNLGLVAYALLMDRKLEKQLEKTPAEAKILEAIVIGHEKGKPSRAIKISDAQLNHHVHIVGASGFGKSVLLSHVISNRIESGSGLLFVDLKADFETIRQVVSTAKAANRLKDLSIFSCGNPEFSSPYNVVGSGTANQLKDRIMGALNWSEEYYKNEASSFLIKLLKGLTTLRDLRGKQFDLGTILKCAQDGNAISEIAKAIPESEREIKLQMESLAAHIDKPENRKVLQGLRSQLESLLLSDFGHLLTVSSGINASGIDLFEAVKSQKIIYVLLDSRTYGESSKALGKLILQDLKAASARIDNEISRDSRTPFTVVVDEFADLATEDFVGFLDRARSSKIGVVVAHQEIADLSRISPEFTRRLMNSTSTMFAFLQKLSDSSETIAGIAGTRRTKEVTEQAKSNWLFGDEKTGMKSVKEVDEFIIHPNVIKSLGVGECVVVAKYPTASAAVVKVKPEKIISYLSNEQVRVELNNLVGPLGVRRVAEVKSAHQTLPSRDVEAEGRF